MRVGKQFTFHAAHHIPHHRGKCRRPHGHTYQVGVTVGGLRQTHGDEAGMVRDFGDIKKAWEELCEPLLDHQDLNVTLLGEIPYTTAECIAVWIFDCLSKRMNVESVVVWETPTSWAECRAGDVTA